MTCGSLDIQYDQQVWRCYKFKIKLIQAVLNGETTERCNNKINTVVSLENDFDVEFMRKVSSFTNAYTLIRSGQRSETC